MAENCYVIAHDPVQAREWWQRNKPGTMFKFCLSSSAMQARGRHLPEHPVYVLTEMLTEVRDAWIATGCRLVYV